MTVDRAARAKDGEAWDRKLLGVMALSNVITFVVAGLDAGRYHWSPPASTALVIAGTVTIGLGQLFFALSKRENDFFSSTVRLQPERGHRVCDTGPYRVVRHPGYLGMLLAVLGFPLLFGSYWAFIPTAFTVVVLAARTSKEDQFLVERLAGYRDYAARCRWRLVPFMW